jgi:hypothetical protein
MPPQKKVETPSRKAFLRCRTVRGSSANYSNFSAVVPSRFRIKKKQRNGRANRALAYGGPAWRLFNTLAGKQPCFYSLKYHNLFLDKKHAAMQLIYDRKTLEIWKEAIRKHIKPPYFFCLEVGKEGQIHTHVVAAIDAGLPGIKRGYNTRTIKIIKSTPKDRQRVISYMYKTPVPIWTDDDDKNAVKLPDWQQRLSDYFIALASIRKTDPNKRVPQLSGYVFR